MHIDTATPFGTRVERRLHDEHAIWLTTVRSDSTPEPNPVWFLWDGSTFLIYGKRDSHKLEHIARDPKVSLNFNSDPQGGDVVVFTGTATIDSSAPPADQNPPYLAKYQQDIQRIGLTPVSFARAYCAPIRVTPTHLRGL